MCEAHPRAKMFITMSLRSTKLSTLKLARVQTTSLCTEGRVCLYTGYVEYVETCLIHFKPQYPHTKSPN